MSGQLSFDFDTSRQPSGLFFAIRLTRNAATRAIQSGRSLYGEPGPRDRPLAMECLHVTLHHLGNYEGVPRGIVATADEAGGTIAARRFGVAFDRAMSFSGRPGKQPFVLCGGDGVSELMLFQHILGMAMKRAGLGRRVKTRYRPHVTLLYGGCRIAERPVETVGWTVREFVLIHSLLGRSRHIPLARWPLRG
jgi:2'-5' RNA ligase